MWKGELLFTDLCRCARAAQVWLLGNAVPLGDFNESGAVELTTSPEAYPLWRTRTPVVMTRGFPVQYRWS